MEELTENELLLIQDLSRRLPYGVKCRVTRKSAMIGLVREISSIRPDGMFSFNQTSELVSIKDAEIKPFLYPLSSIDGKTRKEIGDGLKEISKSNPPYGKLNPSGSDKLLITVTLQASWLIEYYVKNHIDYLGLIDRRLAIDATGLDYYV